MGKFRVLTVLVLGLMSCVQAADPVRQRPNVLFILTDDQRWDAAGIAGHPYLKTPGIDRLGREGRVFSQRLLYDVAVFAQPRQYSQRSVRTCSWGGE